MSELSLIERLEAMSADLSVWQLDDAERLMHEAAQALKASASPVQAEPVPQEAQPVALKTDEAALMVSYNRAKYSRSVDYQDFSAGWIAARQATPTASKDAKDAERYRFLKKGLTLFVQMESRNGRTRYRMTDEGEASGKWKHSYDEAVDAAMQEGGGKG